MALSALEIYKHLPQKNCGECAVATCLGFAMILIAGEAELADCPYLTKEALAFLGASTTLPMRKVELGYEENPIPLGGEEVLFRHDKRFHSPTAILLRLSSSSGTRGAKEALGALQNAVVERAGEVLAPQGFLVEIEGKQDLDIIEFLVSKNRPPLAVVGGSDELKKASEIIPKEHRTLLAPTNPRDLTSVARLGQPLLIPFRWGQSLKQVAQEIETAVDAGMEDIVLSLGGDWQSGSVLRMLAHLRRLAIVGKEQTLNRPTLYYFPGESPAEQSIKNALAVCRYANAVVMDSLDVSALSPLMVLRSELYADPQKPIQIPPGVYPLGAPGKDSPVILTTNFSLTYFLVSGDIEASSVPSHLLIVDVEGQSVLTAYASGKLTPTRVRKLLESCGIEEKVNHHRLIIPGLVSKISGELAEECGWEIVVGPKDSSRLPAFLHSYSSPKEVHLG